MVRHSELLQTSRGKVLRETTDFTYRLLPIGGFVRIKGMIPHDDGREVNIPGGFYSKSPLKRLIVLLAGPVFSVIAGIILLTGVYMADGINKMDNRPILGGVIVATKDGRYVKPAAQAGLKPGDEILTANGEKVRSFTHFVHIVNGSVDKPIYLTYRSDGLTQETILTPRLDKVAVWKVTDGEYMDPAYEFKEQGAIGVIPLDKTIKPSLGQAALEALNAPELAVQGVLRLVSQPSRAKDEAGGAVSMVRMTNEAAKQGLTSIIALAALISISVGIFNLLPVPPLDGGQMLIAFLELLRGGRRLSFKVQTFTIAAGMATIVLLTSAFLFIDLQRATESKPPLKVETVQTTGDAAPR
jgi:regulator of sigma E protease